MPESPNPFQIDGPAVISFSGGRTSAYMLRRVLDAGLQPDVHVLFANTGKERLETLDFVKEVAYRWRVPIRWLERGRPEVDWNTASRDGEPFEALITERKFLPNPVARFCTTELKLKPIAEWMERRGYQDWDTVVGIRADEPKRVATMRERGLLVPLADAGVTRADVMAFWRTQPFDLQLQPHESNCDLCFLKGVGLRRQIVRDHPERLTWWVAQEDRIGGTFRSDAVRYADLPNQRDLFQADDSLTECYCHD